MVLWLGELPPIYQNNPVITLLHYWSLEYFFILYFEIGDILVWNYFYSWCRKMHKILKVNVRQNCKYWPLWRVQRTCPVSRSTPTREPFKRDSTKRESSSGASPVGWICSSCNVKSRVQVNQCLVFMIQNKSITYRNRLSLILKQDP